MAEKRPDIFREEVLRRAGEAAARIKMISQLRDEERHAGGLLIDLCGLGGMGCEPRDVGNEQGVHDFDLVLRDGRRIAVEVTRDAVPAVRSQNNALARHFPAPAAAGGTSDWWINVRPGSGRKAKSLASQLPVILVEAERFWPPGSEVIHSDPAHGDEDAAAVVKLLKRSGVTFAHRSPPGADESRCPRVYADIGSHHRFVGQSDIAATANRHLQKTDNRRKLTKAKESKDRPADESHLFIWASPSEPPHCAASFAMRNATLEDLAGLGVELPPKIDAVWLAVYGAPPEDQGITAHNLWPSSPYPVFRLDRDGWTRWDHRRRRTTGPAWGDEEGLS